MEKPTYFVIIPSKLRYDSNVIPNAKLLYGDIMCLSNKEGYCFATNGYFAELYSSTPQAVSRWIKSLEQNGYVRTELIYKGKEVIQRRIYPLEVSIKSSEGVNIKFMGYQQKVKDNNTRVNNTSYYSPKRIIDIVDRIPEEELKNICF